MNRLHPGVKWQFRISGYFLFVFLGFFFTVPLLAFLVELFGFSNSLLTSFIIYIISSILLVIVLSEIYTQMSYNRWFYEFNDEGLRLERGIIWKRYSNVPYARIQNIDVHRGIIARMCGFSSIMIQTAGFSGPSGAEGNIPAVDMRKAEEIRSFVMKKITNRKK
jgi:membrane protein YdbS with pleckstrin-like domain